MSQYYYDKATRIFKKSYLGEVTLRTITQSWDDLINKDMIPEDTIGFILDYRKAHFNIPLKELKGIGEYYRENIKTFKGKKVAIVTESANDIVVPVIVQKDDKEYSSAPFSTLKAAEAWILER